MFITNDKTKGKAIDNHKKNPNKGGYIALVSAIIMSAIIMLVAVTASFKGFYGRYNILDSEYKDRSLALAEACADQTLLQLANNPSYGGDATTTIAGAGQCYVGVVQNNVPIFGQKTFKTRAVFQNAHTNLEIVINASNIAIVSWKETPTF